MTKPYPTLMVMMLMMMFDDDDDNEEEVIMSWKAAEADLVKRLS